MSLNNEKKKKEKTPGSNPSVFLFFFVLQGEIKNGIKFKTTQPKTKTKPKKIELLHYIIPTVIRPNNFINFISHYKLPIIFINTNQRLFF